LAKKYFLANSVIFSFDRLRGETRTFRATPENNRRPEGPPEKGLILPEENEARVSWQFLVKRRTGK
jgi:hypothetical protein